MSRPGMKTRFESLKLAKEGKRILNFKNKPLKPKTTDQDLPQFKKGRNWRLFNSKERVQKAIKRNQKF